MIAFNDDRVIRLCNNFAVPDCFHCLLLNIFIAVSTDFVVRKKQE